VVKLIGAALAVLAVFPILSAEGQGDPLAPTGRWTAYTAGRAQTPPMGWSSWNAFATDIDEDKIVGSAQALVDSGLAGKGYRYVNIDDGWWLQRRVSDGQLVIRSARFPSTVRNGNVPSFRPFTDRLHAMGLKAGIYSDLGRNSCSQAYSTDETDLPKGSVAEREVGLYGHIDQDIALFFSDWGFDYIKVDGCGLRAFAAGSEKVRSGAYRELKPLLDMDSVARSDIPAVQSLFRQIDAALIRNNPDGDFLLSLCIWGAGNVRAWGKDFGNISRTSDDINPAWGRLLTNFDSAAKRALYAHPGSWNDPDMLFIGKGDFDVNHLVEARSHLSMWAMINAPLMIGMDLRQAPKSLLEIFGNADVIAINQDSAGHQAVVAFDSEEFQIFVKTLSDGDKAVAIFNRSAAPLDVDLTAAHMKFRDAVDVALVDLWNGRQQSFRDRLKLRLEGHQTLIFKARGARVLADGLYLSEQPGNVNPAVDGVMQPAPDPTIHRSAFGWQGTRGSGERPIYAGWGGAQPDSAPYGEALRISGKKFETGIGVLANSRLEVRNQGYRRFTAIVGVNDSARDNRHAVTFTVYGDGRVLATSQPLKWGNDGQQITVDVSAVKIIELVARAATDDPATLPVTWGEAALLSH
jgi:alpha-galactosidase